MKAYTCELGKDAKGEFKKTGYAEEFFAYSLIEAIDRAKAIINTRPAHKDERLVQLIENDPDREVVWTSAIDDVREGQSTIVKDA